MKTFLIGLLLGLALAALPAFSRDFLGPDGALYYEVGPTMLDRVPGMGPAQPFVPRPDRSRPGTPEYNPC